VERRLELDISRGTSFGGFLLCRAQVGTDTGVCWETLSTSTEVSTTEVSTDMRKPLILMLTAAALAVPAATAAPMNGNPGHGNPGHGKPGPKSCHGKAKVMVVLKGTLANQPVAGDMSFQLTVLHANRWGHGYKNATQPYPINVDANTRFVKNDQAATIDQLTMGDDFVVQSKANRCDLLNATDPASLPALTAKMVVDQGLAVQAEEH
jgi:hypothetical protein